VQNTQDTADHGIDLVVTLPQLGLGLVQCKRYRGTVGEPIVRDLYGTLMHERANYGWLATTGGISRQARGWATGKPIDLWDGQKLVEYARKYR
jgi:restriction system protein